MSCLFFPLPRGALRCTRPAGFEPGPLSPEASALPRSYGRPRGSVVQGGGGGIISDTTFRWRSEAARALRGAERRRRLLLHSGDFITLAVLRRLRPSVRRCSGRVNVTAPSCDVCPRALVGRAASQRDVPTRARTRRLERMRRRSATGPRRRVRPHITAARRLGVLQISTRGAPPNAGARGTRWLAHVEYCALRSLIVDTVYGI